jgi:predicted Zn finger-like uncharacterized protein
MVVRCFRCKGLLRVDESNLPSDRRAKIRCPHCKGIGLMPDIPVGSPGAQGGSADIPAHEGTEDYPALLPPEQPLPPQDWKEAAIPQDAFKTFRYPGERENREPPKQPVRRGWPLWVWILVSVAIVGAFALLVNVILPGPAGVRPVVHTVPPEQAGPPAVTEENIGVRSDRALPGIQDR